jgi:hypothetical protein
MKGLRAPRSGAVPFICTCSIHLRPLLKLLAFDIDIIERLVTGFDLMISHFKLSLAHISAGSIPMNGLRSTCLETYHGLMS